MYIGCVVRYALILEQCYTFSVCTVRKTSQAHWPSFAHLPRISIAMLQRVRNPIGHPVEGDASAPITDKQIWKTSGITVRVAITSLRVLVQWALLSCLQVLRSTQSATWDKTKACERTNSRMYSFCEGTVGHQRVHCSAVRSSLCIVKRHWIWWNYCIVISIDSESCSNEK